MGPFPLRLRAFNRLLLARILGLTGRPLPERIAALALDLNALLGTWDLGCATIIAVTAYTIPRLCTRHL